MSAEGARSEQKHEVWDDRREQKHPWSVFIQCWKRCKTLRDSFVDEHWNYKESIHKWNICSVFCFVFLARVKTHKSYRNLLKLQNISKYMRKQVKLHICTLFLFFRFKILIYYVVYFSKYMHISSFIFSL